MSSFAPLLRRPAPPATKEKDRAPGTSSAPPAPMRTIGWQALERQADAAGARLAPKLAGRGDLGPGPLSSGVRRIAEGDLGVEMSGVTLRADAEAARAVAPHGALALTEGTTVRFGAGQLRPDLRGGALLGHELAHVAQQRLGGYVGVHAAMPPGPQPQPVNGASSPGQAIGPMSVLSTPKTWKEFVAFMAAAVGAADVHVGTYSEQDGREGPGIPAQGWTSGDPGPVSDLYGVIADAVRDFSNNFGGLPDVKTVIFFARRYQKDPKTGVVTPDVGTAGSFGAGELVIYTDAAQKGPFTLPKRGGGVDQPTREENVHRVLSHELGHGIAETFHDRVDPTVFDRWKKEIGWFNNQLYDISQPVVQKAIQAGQKPPDERMVGIQSYPVLIQKGNWDSTLFGERPISAYSLDNPGEDFAESVMAFVEAPSILAARSPRRFAFIQSVQQKVVPLLSTLPRPGDFPTPRGNTRVA
ncbi:MAG TPA: DUF4157 domain-containing protein [Polyangia bacterium]